VGDDAARRSGKSESAFRTISEVSTDLNVPQHVLRFWETKFSQIRPMKRGGGRRYYRPEDVALLAAIRDLLYNDGYTIKGAQKLLRENGIKTVISQNEEGRERLGIEDDGPELDREPSFAFDAPEPEDEPDDAPPLVDEGESELDDGAADAVFDGDENEESDLDDGEVPGVSPDFALNGLGGDVEEAIVSPPAPERPSSVATPDARLSVATPDARLSVAASEPPAPEPPVIMVAGLTDDQRLELEVVLSELEDLRRILRRVEL
jgi:DNA-binding transcriptional MerR regulator